MNRGTAAKRLDRPRMRIGDVAARAGVNPQTLRYYERRGIIGERFEDQRGGGCR